MKAQLLTPILLGLMGGSFLAFGHSAIEPVPRGEAWWKERHALLNQRAAEQGAKAQVIFIGDSITQGWEGAGKEVWEQYYAPRNAVNLGIGGDRTQHVLWRLDNGNLEGINPKAAIVMIGTNNSNGEDNSVSQIADGVRAIVQKLREKLPDTHVLLCAIFPRSESPVAQRGKLLLVNQIIRRLASDPMVQWVDFGHRFVNDAGLIPAELMPDYLHLSPAGYRIWAEAIERPLTRILEGNPAPARRAANLTGDWIATLPGPDGQPIDVPFTLRQEGSTLTGQFARGDGRWLPIEQGSIQGRRLSWVINRDRPDGGTMTYRMNGAVQDGQIQGQSRTEVDGREITIDWKARRN